MEPQSNQAQFSQLEFREILLTFLYKTIKGEYKNPQALKRNIIKAYKRNGIDQTQRDGLLMSLNLEREPKGTKYTREELLNLLSSLLNDNYITSLDYAIALNLGASRDIFSHFVKDKYLELYNIDLETSEEDIIAIVEELNNI